MKLIKVTTVAIFLIACAVSGGCGKGEEADSSAITSSTPANPQSGPSSLEGANAAAGRGGAAIVHEPPSDGKIPPGGIMITPKDPNDPRFKPGPGIAGGG